MSIKIDKNKAVPKGVYGYGAAEFREALRGMEVGDSFKFKASQYNNLRIVLAGFNAQEKKFVTKKEDAENRRCWRTV